MIRFRSFTAAALVASLLATGVAFAQGPRGGGPGGLGRAGGAFGRMGGLPLASLNLTQAQQDLIRDIRERNREAARPLEERLREAQEAQRKAVESIPPNEAAIRTATLALAEVQADLAIHQARMQTEIWNALTSAQQEQLKQLQAQRDERRSETQNRRRTRQ